jgi:hypothetical protein
MVVRTRLNVTLYAHCPSCISYGLMQYVSASQEATIRHVRHKRIYCELHNAISRHVLGTPTLHILKHNTSRNQLAQTNMFYRVNVIEQEVYKYSIKIVRMQVV